MKKSRIAGILLILCFLSTVTDFLWRMFIDGMWEDANSGSGLGGLAMLGVFFAVFKVLLSVGALAGGISAWLGKSFVLAMAGAIIGLITIGFLYTGTIIAALAIVLLVMSREEFEDMRGPIHPFYAGAPTVPTDFPPPPDVPPPDLNLPHAQDSPHSPSVDDGPWYRPPP